MVEFCSRQPLSYEAPTQGFTRTFGGDTLNCLVAASRLGSRCGYLTRVGDDPFAEFLLASWRREGINLDAVRRVPGFNGIYFISTTPAGEREFHYYRRGSAASALRRSDLSRRYLARARALHSSGITQALSPSARKCVAHAYRQAKNLGLLTSFDPNFRPRLWSAEEARAAFAEIVPCLDVVLPSAPEDTLVLAGTADPRRAIDRFWKLGVAIVAVKHGANGCWLGYQGSKEHVAAFPARVVDSTGAGDAFDGAFLHALALGMPPPQAARLAAATAALSLKARGAIAGLPGRGAAYRLAGL
jgi:2-dehydro-3-deoxygluconokinase